MFNSVPLLIEACRNQLELNSTFKFKRVVTISNKHLFVWNQILSDLDVELDELFLWRIFQEITVLWIELYLWIEISKYKCMKAIKWAVVAQLFWSWIWGGFVSFELVHKSKTWVYYTYIKVRLDIFECSYVSYYYYVQKVYAGLRTFETNLLNSLWFSCFLWQSASILTTGYSTNLYTVPYVPKRKHMQNVVSSFLTHHTRCQLILSRTKLFSGSTW